MPLLNWRACDGCGRVERISPQGHLCLDCSKVICVIRTPAYWMVRAAVAGGFLPRAKTQKCVDCGGAASRYDHRDYSQPLAVEPVCGRCNNLRGSAINGGIEHIRAPFEAAHAAP